MTHVKNIELNELLSLYTGCSNHLGCFEVIANLGRRWKVQNTKTSQTGILSVFWDKQEAFLELNGISYPLTCFDFEE